MSTSGPRTEATKAILAYIREHQPVLHSELLDRFRPQAAAVGMSAARWLDGRLTNMRDAGFVEHGPSGWTAPAERNAPRERAERAPRESKPVQEPQASCGTSMALPRRTSMFGPVWKPAPQVHRAGSTDYAAKPSLINGRPRAYRSAW